MQHDALANVYARSIFEMARDAGGQSKIEEISSELQQIIELTRSDKDFGKFINSPIIDVNARRDSLRKLFDGRVSDLTLRFLLVLNQKERLNRLETIASAYEGLVQEEYGRVEVDVFTAAPIGDEATASIRARIEEAIGKEPVLHTYEDPNMIGGVKLRIGDQLIDGSVQTKLRQMKADLLSSGGYSLRERITDFIQDGDK